MRGLEKVRADFSLTAPAYNLWRVLNILAFPYFANLGLAGRLEFELTLAESEPCPRFSRSPMRRGEKTRRGWRQLKPSWVVLGRAKLAMPSAFPYQAEYRAAHAALRAAA